MMSTSCTNHQLSPGLWAFSEAPRLTASLFLFYVCTQHGGGEPERQPQGEEKGHIESAIGEDASILRLFATGPPGSARRGPRSWVNSVYYQVKLLTLQQEMPNTGSIFLHCITLVGIILVVQPGVWLVNLSYVHKRAERKPRVTDSPGQDLEMMQIPNCFPDEL